MAPYHSLNVGTHVADDNSAVNENRRLLCQSLNINTPPLWLSQVHGSHVVEYDQVRDMESQIKADGCYTTHVHQVCTVMTADCLPVAIYNHTRNSIAVVHAGWKGLAAGIIANSVNSLKSGEYSVWLGPAIGPEYFEVGDEVREAFVSKLPDHANAFMATETGKWFADMYLLARQQLESLGITRVFGGDYCTYRDSGQFFSYRREQITGRMATLVWLTH